MCVTIQTDHSLALFTPLLWLVGSGEEGIDEPREGRVTLNKTGKIKSLASAPPWGLAGEKRASVQGRGELRIHRQGENMDRTMGLEFEGQRDSQGRECVQKRGGQTGGDTELPVSSFAGVL